MSLYNIAFVHRAANSKRLRIPSLLAASTPCILLQMHISLPRPSAQNCHCHSPPPPSLHFLERRHRSGEFKGTIVGEHKCDYLQECRMYSQGWKGHNVKACIQSDVKPLPPSHSPYTHTLQSPHVQLLGSEGPGNIQAWCYLTQVPIIQVLQIGLVVRCLIVEVSCWLVSEYRE